MNLKTLACLQTLAASACTPLSSSQQAVVAEAVTQIEVMNPFVSEFARASSTGVTYDQALTTDTNQLATELTLLPGLAKHYMAEDRIKIHDSSIMPDHPATYDPVIDFITFNPDFLATSPELVPKA